MILLALCLAAYWIVPNWILAKPREALIEAVRQELAADWKSCGVSFAAVLLWLRGSGAWSAAAFLMLREFCVTAPLTVPATALYRAVHRRAHRDD